MQLRRPFLVEMQVVRQSGKLTINQALTDDDNVGSVRLLQSSVNVSELDEEEQQPQVKQVRDVVIPDSISVSELANRMAERTADVVKELMKLGAMRQPLK